MEQGKPETAVKFLTRALALNPTYGNSLSLRADAYDKLGKHDLAEKDRNEIKRLGRRAWLPPEGHGLGRKDVDFKSEADRDQTTPLF